jgi:hypothetical protein
MADECTLCELEETLRERSRGLRKVLQSMNPADVDYEGVFTFLVTTDTDLRTLRGRQVDA